MIWNNEFGQILAATTGQCRAGHFIITGSNGITQFTEISVLKYTTAFEIKNNIQSKLE